MYEVYGGITYQLHVWREPVDFHRMHHIYRFDNCCRELDIPSRGDGSFVFGNHPAIRAKGVSILFFALVPYLVLCRYIGSRTSCSECCTRYFAFWRRARGHNLMITPAVSFAWLEVGLFEIREFSVRSCDMTRVNRRAQVLPYEHYIIALDYR